MQEGDRFFRFLLALSVAAFLGAGFFVQPAAAQSFGLGSFSPMVWFPPLEAEVQVQPKIVHISGGSVSGPNGGSLREHFRLTENEVFMDATARLQLSRLSFRVSYQPLVFPRDEVILKYSGVTVGADFDVIQWNRTRLGIDFDYDCFSPRFSITLPRTVIIGDNAATLGFHASYNPLRTFCGLSPIVKLRARWPIAGSDLTDWQISAGVAGPNTILGSVSLTAGYRNTQLSFDDRDAFGNRVDATFDGWFAELAYYY